MYLFLVTYFLTGLIFTLVVYHKEDRHKYRVLIEAFMIIFFFPYIMLNPLRIWLQKKLKNKGDLS